MIQPDTFYKETNQNFQNLSTKIDSLHKETQTDIASINKKLDTHVAVAKALDERDEKDEKKNSRRNYFITGLIVTIILGFSKIFEYLS